MSNLEAGIQNDSSTKVGWFQAARAGGEQGEEEDLMGFFVLFIFWLQSTHFSKSCGLKEFVQGNLSRNGHALRLLSQVTVWFYGTFTTLRASSTHVLPVLSNSGLGS